MNELPGNIPETPGPADRRVLRSEDNINPRENIALMHLTHAAFAMNPMHAHEFIEIVYVEKGQGRQMFPGGIEIPVERGSVVFLNRGQAHSFMSEAGFSYYNILLQPEFMSESLVNSLDAFSLLALSAFSDFRDSIEESSPVLRFGGRELMELDDLVRRMFYEFTAKEPGYRTVLHGYMQVLFTLLFRKMSLPVSEPQGSRALTPELLAYIEEHFCEHLTLTELAAKCFYNPSYFSRVFKECSGVGLTEYIHRRRVERAVKLLTETRESVAEISAAVGYSDKKQLYRQCKLLTGKTPGELRAQASGAAAGPGPARPSDGPEFRDTDPPQTGSTKIATKE